MNFLTHDKVSRMLALERKEELQIAIEEQQEMGLDGLAEEPRATALRVAEKKDKRYVCSLNIIMSNLLSQYLI